MSKFSVTATELVSAANMLSEDNNQFRARVNDLVTCASELASMWEGEANNQFNTAFNNDQERWSEFAVLIDQYVEALNAVARAYAQAEETNVSTAATRTY